MRAPHSHSHSHSHSHYHRSTLVTTCSSWLRHPVSIGVGFLLGFITCSIIVVNMWLFGGFASPDHGGFTPSSADRALVSSLLGGDPAQMDSDIYNHIIHEDHTSAFLLHCLQSTHAPPHSLIVPTRTHPSFALTIQDPQRDPYISKALLQYGVWDAHILQILSPLLQRNCMRSVASLTPANAGSFQRKKKKQQETEDEDDENPPSPIQRSRIIEINANVAFFSLYAASMGCDVAIYEPVPSHYQCILTSICANPTLGPRLTVSPHAITTAHNTTTTVYTGQHFGRRGNDGAINSMDCHNQDHLEHCQNVTGVNLDRELGKIGDIFLVKINLDQNTLQIVKSMSNLLKASKIQYVLMAYAPKLYGLDDAQSVLRTMDDHGYEATEILYTDTLTSAATQNRDNKRQSLFERLRSHLSYQSLFSQKTRKIDSREIDNFAIQIFQCNDEPKLCYVDLLFTLKITQLPF